MPEQDNHRMHVQEPCPMAWSQLTGDARKRFCSECQLHVHNGEEMTRREAEAIVRTSSERVCMRLVTDQNGNPIFKPESSAAHSLFKLRKPSKLRAAGWALAASGVLAACQPPGKRSEPTPTNTVEVVDGHVDYMPKELPPRPRTEHPLAGTIRRTPSTWDRGS